jgi:copper chaperone
MEAKYKVSGMTCGGCSRSVTNAIERISSDLKVTVSLDEASVVVVGEHQEEVVKEAVEDAGFDFGGPM